MSTPSPVRVDLDMLSEAVADAIDNRVPGCWDIDDVFEDIAEDVTYSVCKGLIEARDTDLYGDQPVGDPIVCLSPDDSPADIVGDILRGLHDDDLAASYTAPHMSSDLRDIHDACTDEVAEWATGNIDLSESVADHGIDGLIDDATSGWLESVAYSVAMEITGDASDDIADDVADEITVA